MTAPAIHMNGTGRDALVDQMGDAHYALRKALDAMSEAYPNGRDYYTLGDRVIWQAEAEHASRVDRIKSVMAEYEALAEAINK